jgi:hypothetical protein
MENQSGGARGDVWAAASAEFHYLKVMAAMYSGDVNRIAMALASVPADLRLDVALWRGEKGETMLTNAVRHRSEQMAREAIAWGASVDVMNDSGKCALYSAVEAGHLGLVDLLIDSGACVNVMFKEHGTSALMRSLSLDGDDIASRLIRAGADPRLTSLDGHNAIDYVFLFDAAQPFVLLHELGVWAKSAVEPLYRAAEASALEIVEFCLADPVLMLPALRDPWEKLEKACFFDPIRDRIMACRTAHQIDVGLRSADDAQVGSVRNLAGMAL